MPTGGCRLPEANPAPMLPAAGEEDATWEGGGRAGAAGASGSEVMVFVPEVAVARGGLASRLMSCAEKVQEQIDELR